MMKRTAILLSLLLCYLCPSQAQVQMFFSSDSLASITSPLDVDSLFYWFAADVAVLDSAGGTISSGEGVGQWSDLSGNGYHVVQADTTKDPRWCASCGPASYPAIVFNGVDEFLASSSHWWGSDDITVFVVMKFGNATRNASEAIIGRYETVSPANNRQLILTSSGAADSYVLRYLWSDTGVSLDGEIFDAKSTSYRLIYIQSQSSNATTNAFVDGVDVADTDYASGTNYTSMLDATINTDIGAVGSTGGGVNAFLQGSISEIIVYSRALTTAERQAIENYLNTKYDLY